MSDRGAPHGSGGTYAALPAARPGAVVEFLQLDLDTGAVVPMVWDGVSCCCAEEKWELSAQFGQGSRRAQLEHDLSLSASPALIQACGELDEDDFLLRLADHYASDRD